MKTIKLLFVSLLFVIIGTFTFMRSAFVKPVYVDAPLTISTTESKNSLSAGYEIRIKSIIVNNKEIIHQMPVSDGWEKDGDLLACYEKDGIKHSVSLPLKRISNIKITFIGQIGSGNAMIAIGNHEAVIDLYRDSDWEEITWAYQVPTVFSPLSRIDILLEMVLMIWLILGVIKFWRSSKCL